MVGKSDFLSEKFISDELRPSLVVGKNIVGKSLFPTNPRKNILFPTNSCGRKYIFNGRKLCLTDDDKYYLQRQKFVTNNSFLVGNKYFRWTFFPRKLICLIISESEVVGKYWSEMFFQPTLFIKFFSLPFNGTCKLNCRSG